MYFHFALVFGILILSSGASSVSGSEIVLIFYCGVNILYSLFTGKLFAVVHEILATTILWVLLLGFYFFQNGATDYHTWMGFLLKILIALFAVRLNKGAFIERFISIVYFLAFVSLFGYTLQLLIPETFFALNNFFGIEARQNSNSLFFNFSYVHPFRNSGCMWEPGAFAAVLVIALLLVQVYEIKVPKSKLIVLSLAVLTTFSSLGYICLALFIIHKFLLRDGLNKRYRYALFAVPVIIFAFTSIDILGNKLSEQVTNLDQEVNLAANNPNYAVSVTRFASFAIDYKTFLARPATGYGIDSYTTNKDIIYRDFGENINRSSGLASILLQVGLLGCLFYFLIIYRGFRSRLNRLNARFGVLILVLVLFSNPLQFSPLMFSLLFIGGCAYDTRHNSRIGSMATHKSLS